MIQLGDEYFMREALKEADKAWAAQEVPIGAVVVSNKHIIARAHNQVERLQDATAHAEILALTSAFAYLGSKYLPNCALYATVEPCCMCVGAMYWAQLGRLVFGTHDPQRGYTQIAAPLLHPSTQVTKHVLSQEARQRVTHFFQRLRN